MGKSLELFDDVSIRFTYVGMSMHRYVYEYGFRFKLNAVCVWNSVIIVTGELFE